MAWYVTGSHNLSKAAWGELQVGASQLGMRSYELSILLLPSTEAAYRLHRHYGFSLAPFRPGTPTSYCIHTLCRYVFPGFVSLREHVRV